MRKRIFILFSLIILATIAGCENSSESKRWKASPTFTIPITFGDGTEGEYRLIGTKGKIGFLIGSGNKGKSEEMPIVANKTNKYMWFIWGDGDPISGNFKVVGLNWNGKKHPVLVTGNKEVWEYPNISVSSNNGAVSQIPSNMVFPTSGLWQLKVYFNDRLFEEIVIDVKDK
ncbi:DUF4871 domain-containing protein [Bacillus sp. 1P06AnD]|uniref:DUF4871 domain-containing protein n=1 Tax=Bacillus sp. 1P06AnD TaxID=3132208 RepID=UPI0039A0A9AB